MALLHGRGRVGRGRRGVRIAATCAPRGSLTVVGLGIQVPAQVTLETRQAVEQADDVLYLLAVREGLLSVVSVLAALYPVSTVVLARVVLHERFATLQRIGIVIALPSAVLMAT